MPRLSMAMMVRDEEEFLEDALLSVKDVVDEMIVVDTGSVDRTVEIARDLGAKVTFFEWCDSFSLARNETLRRAAGDWILVLDADERLRGPRARELAKSLPDARTYPFQVFMIDVINTKLSGEVISSANGVRIIPNDDRLGYEGRVHNDFCSTDPAFPEIRASLIGGVEIVHLGYDPTVYKRRKKAERSLPLLEGSVADNPGNVGQRYYLGREYLRVDRLSEAIATFDTTLELLKTATDHERSTLHAATMRDLIEAKRADGRALPDLLTTAVEGLRAHPTVPDLWFVTARALNDHGQKLKALEYFHKALECCAHAPPPAQRQQWSAVGQRQWEILERMGGIFGDLNRLEEAYAALTEALKSKPETSHGYAELLNSLCGLGTDLGDDGRMPDILGRLAALPDAPLDMLFIAIDSVAVRRGKPFAKALLQSTAEGHSRVSGDDRYAAALARLG